MRLCKLAVFAALIAMVPMAMTSTATAASYSAVIVYGDSLSDNGNIYALTGTPASPPYYNGRFSNGPVAVEQFANKLGVPLLDYAYGGATSGVGNEGDGGTQTSLGLFGLPGLEAEVASTLPLLPSSLVSSALFVVWGGANDFLVNGSPLVGVADIDGIVNALLADGAKNILVPNVPNLGLTPDYPNDQNAINYSLTFDKALAASLPAGATYVDTAGLLEEIETNPAKYGITDLTDPCLNVVAGTVCSNPSQYLFWDGFHPTTTVDSLVAQQFLDAVTPVPEPSSILLLGTGLAGLLIAMRRRMA